MAGSKRICFRDSENFEEQIKAKSDNVSDFVKLAVKEKLEGKSQPVQMSDNVSDSKELASDIIWLVKDFFNNGGSKQICSPEQIQKIQSIYRRAKNVQQ
jgi:hypothetical protein